MTDVEIVHGGVLKTGDTGPSLRLRLIDENGDPANLTGFTPTLSISLADSDSTIVDESITVVDPSIGLVEYDWQSGDTDEAGTYVAEVKTTDGTDTISYPNDRYFRVRIMEDLT